MCFQAKREVSMKEMQQEADGKRIIVPMLTFYKNSFPYEMVRVCEETSKMIRGTIMELEQTNIIKR
jgi:hypothetical protein